MKRIVLMVVITVFASSPLAASSVRRAAKPVRGEYIVVLNDNAVPGPSEDVAERLATLFGFKVRASFSHVLKGFAMDASEAAATALAQSPLVRYVEENGEVHLAAQQPVDLTSMTSDPNASMWGLSRIDQLFPSYPRVDSVYEYCTVGQDVRVYVVDTGIMEFHPEFNGFCFNNDCTVKANRVGPPRIEKTPGLQAELTNAGYPNGAECWDPPHNNFTANAGHGTSVASIIGGLKYGVAKNATLVDARAIVCNGVGNVNAVLIALDWIARDDASRCCNSAVVNMSFVSGSTTMSGNALVDAVDRLTDTYGMTVVAAAGNDANDVFWYSPAVSNRVITVGGLNKATDTVWAPSNFNRIEFYAPSQFVESVHTQITGLGFSKNFLRSEAQNCDGVPDRCISGTSFGAAFVSGAVARYLNVNRTATRDQVVAYLNNQSATHTGITVFDPRGGGGSAPVLNINDCQ